MAWKEMRNEERLPKITHSGICKFSGNQAEVTAFFSGTVECKMDLQKTYRFEGYKCTLQEENGCSKPVCMDECPLIQKECL